MQRNRPSDAWVMLILLGACFGLMSLITIEPRLGLSVFAIGIAAFTGGYIAALCGILLAWLGLGRKNLRQVRNWILVIVSPIVILCAKFYGPFVFQEDLRFVFIPACAFMATGVALVFLLPNLPGPGHCQYCDYDLTGNVSGVCPECGEDIDQTNSA